MGNSTPEIAELPYFLQTILLIQIFNVYESGGHLIKEIRKFSFKEKSLKMDEERNLSFLDARECQRALDKQKTRTSIAAHHGMHLERLANCLLETHFDNKLLQIFSVAVIYVCYSILINRKQIFL